MSQHKEIGSSKLGFFSKPILLTEGEHAGKVMKSYKFIKNRKICEALLAIHSEYIPQLEATGIKVPKTETEIIEHKGKYSIRIYQEAFSADMMVRKFVEEGDLETCIFNMNGVLDGAITFLNYTHKNSIKNLGFHPTTRNYAVTPEGEFWYFDTFPPMADLTQNELEWYIMHFSPYKIPNWFKYVAKPFMNKVTDEYYQADKMFLGIVGSCCRLRPEFTNQILKEAIKKAHDLANSKEKNKIIQQLKNPPKLPWIWTFVRKILGKEGKSNISKK